MKKRIAKSVGIITLISMLLAIAAVGVLQYMAAKDNNKNLTQGKLDVILEKIAYNQKSLDFLYKITTDTGEEPEELAPLEEVVESCSFLQEVTVGETGFAYAIDTSTGLIKAHKEDSVIGKAATEYKFPLVTDDGFARHKDFYGFYDQIEHDGMIYGIFIPTYEYFSGTLWDTLFVFLNIIIQLSICAFAISRAIDKQALKPISNIITSVQKITEGDLDCRLTEHRNAEVTFLSDNINSMVENMQVMIEVNDELLQKQEKNLAKSTKQLATIKEICGVLDMTSHETMENAYSIHTGTESQEEAISYLKQLMDSLVAQLHASADASQEVSTLTENTAQRMFQSRTQMKELEEAMLEISEMAVKIEKIIGDINSIAQQTNMLSLNASIEAARAGDMGRGFSVVAAQVGELAAKSAEAAKETRELIMGSVAAVEKGKSISLKTMENFDGMAEEVESANRHVKGMASMVRSNAEEISRAMEGLTKIEYVVEQNVSISENSKQVSESMAKETERLKELMGE